MRFASLLGTVALATAASAQGQAQVQAQIKMMAVGVFKDGARIGRGLCVARPIERDGRKERYFYSRTAKLSLDGVETSVGEVEAWWTAEGKPLRAIYTGTGPGSRLRAEATFSEDRVVVAISNTVRGRTASNRTEVPIAKGTEILLTPFDAMLIEGKLDKKPKRYLLLQPLDGGILEWSSSYVGTIPMGDVTGHEFELKSGKLRTRTILHEEAGFLRTDQSDGHCLVRVGITPPETEFLRNVAQRAGLTSTARN